VKELKGRIDRGADMRAGQFRRAHASRRRSAC
jgi:hypothetical protein